MLKFTRQHGPAIFYYVGLLLIIVGLERDQITAIAVGAFLGLMGVWERIGRVARRRGADE